MKKKEHQQKCIPVRISDHDLDLITRAAILDRRSKNAFFIEAALRLARRILKKHGTDVEG